MGDRDRGIQALLIKIMMGLVVVALGLAGSSLRVLPNTHPRVCTAPQMGLLEFLNAPKGKFLNGRVQETLAPRADKSNIQNRNILDVFGKAPEYDTRLQKTVKKKVMPVQF